MKLLSTEFIIFCVVNQLWKLISLSLKRLLSHKNEGTQWQNLVILSRHLFVLKRTFFSGSRDTSVCLWGAVWWLQQRFPFISNSYRQGTSRPPRNVLNVFFFFFPVTLHLIVSLFTMKNLARQEMSFGRMPTVTVIPSFMTATLCLLPNFSPSGSGCIVSFSPTVDLVDNDSLE